MRVLETQALYVPALQTGYLNFIASRLIGDRERRLISIGGRFYDLERCVT
jgi:hypothetical protein